MTVQNSEFNPDSSRIHLLPEHLVDQIKAGEVIERPASLIKEILENSIDAGSSKIDLHIVNNGMDLISLVDDGQGMTFHELPFAFCRHATSKIERFEDLYHLNSYGFRGEALASISAVARVTCTSSTEENSSTGGKIVFHGGECLGHDQQNNLPKGTSLFIKDLFYNTPARLKFVKSAQSEKNAIKRMVDAALLANPYISFSLKWDDQDRAFYPATELPEERIAQVLLPKTKDRALHTFQAEYEGHRVTAYFSEQSSRGNAYKRQFLFANKRIFTDRQIHQTILRNIERLYPQGESGHYCVFIDVPENLIDVNVHPNKTQIKFFKLPVITALISSEIKKLAPHEDTQGNLLSTHDSYEQNQEDHQFTSPSPFSNNIFNSGGDLRDNHYRPRVGQNYYREQERAEKVQSDVSDLVVYESEESNEKWLISLNYFWRATLSALQNHLHEEDKDFIPLLISEPFYLTAQNNEQALFEYCKNCGFICERVDEETVALRAIHQLLDPLENSPNFILEVIGGNSGRFDSFYLPLNRIKSISTSLALSWSSFATSIDNDFYTRNFSSDR